MTSITVGAVPWPAESEALRPPRRRPARPATMPPVAPALLPGQAHSQEWLCHRGHTRSESQRPYPSHRISNGPQVAQAHERGNQVFDIAICEVKVAQKWPGVRQQAEILSLRPYGNAFVRHSRARGNPWVPARTGTVRICEICAICGLSLFPRPVIDGLAIIFHSIFLL